MGRGKTLTTKEMAEIDLLVEMNWSYRKIANKLHRSDFVVRNYCKNKEEYGKNRVGRTKFATTKRENRRILKEASNSMSTARLIKDRLKVGASLRTVQRLIKKSPFIKRRKLRRKPNLKPHHKIARMAFAENHIEWTQAWKNVVFTDEKKFNLDGPDGFQYYFHDLRKEERCLMRRQHGGGSVMAWGAITSKGVLDLVILDGIQTAAKYLKLLKEQKLKMTEVLEQQSFIFQQDNAAIHTAKVVKEWFQSENMNVCLISGPQYYRKCVGMAFSSFV